MADDPNTLKPKGPGRPKGSRVVNEERTAVSVWIPVSVHARLVRSAYRHHNGSISAAIRHALRVKLR